MTNDSQNDPLGLGPILSVPAILIVYTLAIMTIDEGMWAGILIPWQALGWSLTALTVLLPVLYVIETNAKGEQPSLIGLLQFLRLFHRAKQEAYEKMSTEILLRESPRILIVFGSYGLAIAVFLTKGGWPLNWIRSQLGI